MSLRLRLTIILVGLVFVTVVASWFIAGYAVLHPFGRELMKAHLAQVLYIADEIEDGADSETLANELGVSIDITRRPPIKPTMRAAWRRHRCDREELRDRPMIICHGERAPVSVKTLDGWVTVRRDIDVDLPRERIGRFLLFLAVAGVLLGLYIAAVATRPLGSTREAMRRVASGDLDHRLPESGPKELAQLGQQFNRMTERVREMLQTERSLMAGISHEIRTPLARLRLQLELLADKGVPDDRLSAMTKDVEEVDELIGELLEISRLRIGDRQLVSQPVDLERVAKEAVERSQSDSHPITIRGSALEVSGDHDRLVRVVSNLVSNAVKHTPEKTPIEVELDGRKLTVRDRGPGVPEGAVDHLFEPFYRTPATSRTAGLGLGMMIAHQIVTLHGGTITAQNREGGGLEISFELPHAPNVTA